MNESDKKKLQNILRKIDFLRKEIEELIGEAPKKTSQKSKTSQEVKEFIKSIGHLSASDLEAKLTTFGHKELGDIFVGVGGTGGDKRKPKAWLIERIMWLSKEFSKSHKSIRESKKR